MSSDLPEQSAVSSRRSFLAKGVGLALTVVAGGGVAGAATKKKVVKKVPPKKPTSTPASTAASTSPASASPASTAAPAPAPATTGTVGTMDINFSYTPEGGGRINNPYVAVWIEDANGLPVRTVHVNVLQGQKGMRWLRDLERWAAGDQTRQLTGGADILATVSSATRAPGAYKFAFDGLDDNKTPLPSGNYVFLIEAAREHGPYSLIKESITLGAEAFTKKLADNTELTSATIAYTPKK